MNLKYIISILLFISNFFASAQIEPNKNEISKIFYNLNIDNNFSKLIDEANTINPSKNIQNTKTDYYTGFFKQNSAFTKKAKNYSIEIFRSHSYAVSEYEFEDLEILSLRAHYGTKLNTRVKKEFNILIEKFKSYSNKTLNVEQHADSGLIGIGTYFYYNEDDKLPFLWVGLIYGSCTDDEKNIEITYFRRIQ